MKLTDGIERMAAVLPQPVPPRTALLNCKIVAHRGEYDNRTVLENTLPAFECARARGVWGIECDIRWTADLVPVIAHDADGHRLFNQGAQLSALDFAEVRSLMPQIPTLAELLAEFAGSVHLMLELKRDALSKPRQQNRILREHLAALRPGSDFHLLALDATVFERVDFVPPECCVLVAELNVPRLSRTCLSRNYGGLAGHFLLLNNRLKRRHERAGQAIGTGFVNSGNILFRELNRGVEWIFSDRAAHIQAIRDTCLA